MASVVTAQPLCPWLEAKAQWRERMDKLTGERAGHRLIDSVTFGPCVGEAMGAERTVEPWKHGRVVAVAPLAIVGVMPMVKGGRSQKPFERPQTPYIRAQRSSIFWPTRSCIPSIWCGLG